MATEDFPVLLAPSDSMLPLEVFDRTHLVEYPSRKIWIYEAEAWLPSNGLKFYDDGTLFEGRAGSVIFSEELDLKASFTLGTLVTVFQAKVYAILVCSDYQGLCFSAGTLYRDFLFKMGFNCFWFPVTVV
jgi:hypothetical protein